MCTLFLLGGVTFALAATSSDSIIVNQSVSNCVINGICESSEDGNSCPTDCAIACSDHLDNDGDGFIDYPNDTGCSDANDTTEISTTTVSTGGGGTGVGSGFGSSYTGVHISGLNIISGALRAEIYWQTNQFSTSKIFWGKTTDYDDGSLFNLSYVQNHEGLLTDLSPGTVYYFKLFAETTSGLRGEETGSFVTSESPGKEETPNVTDLVISGGTSGLVVSWTNPRDENFSSVRVVRKTSGFPAGPTDGDVIYSGPGTFVFDRDVQEGVRYYYGVFAESSAGRFASGAVGSFLVPQNPGSSENGNNATPGGNEGNEINPPTGGVLTLDDLIFVQKNMTYKVTSGNVTLEPGFPFSVLLSVNNVPTNVVSIFFERSNEKDGKTTDYILERSKTNDLYKALFPAYFTKGDYPFTIFAKETNGKYYRLSGTITIPRSEAVGTSTKPATNQAGFFTDVFALFMSNIKALVLALLFILLAIVFFLLGRRSRRKNTEK